MKEKPRKTEKAKADPRNEENVSFVHRPFMMTTMMALKALPQQQHCRCTANNAVICNQKITASDET